MGEILYQARGNCVSVPLGLDAASPVIGQERVLFQREFANDRSIQVILHPDGQSLWYLDTPEESLGDGLPIRFILNWTGD